MPKACWLIVLLFGCAVPPTYVTKHGLRVYCEDACIDQTQVEIATEVVATELENQLDKLKDRNEIFRRLKKQSDWHKLKIIATQYGNTGSCATASNPRRPCYGFRCGESSENGWCLGLTEKDAGAGTRAYTMTVVGFGACVADTELVHELLHFFQGMMWNKMDHRHATKPYWRHACGGIEESDLRYICVVNSIESRSEVVVRLMNPDYCQ